MSAFAKRLRREEGGYTLIELIAALSLLSIVSLTIYAVLHFGFAAYHKITIENSLRDEGDLLMSTVMQELYDYGPKSVAQTAYGIRLIGDAGNPAIRIEGGALHIDKTGSNDAAVETKSTLTDASRIRVSCRGMASECASGLIEVSLTLSQSYGGREQRLTLDSRFGF